MVMYVNYQVMTSKNLTLYELGVLQLIKQNKTEDLSAQIEFEVKDTQILEKFSNLGYIEFIKAKKGQTQYHTIRISKKAGEVLSDIETPYATEGDLAMYDHLKSMYLFEREDRSVGNEKLSKIYCAQFRQIMGLTLYEMYWLCDLFIQRVEFTKVLELIFFSKKENPYSKFKDNIEASKLYQFYNENKKDVEWYWSQKIKTE